MRLAARNGFRFVDARVTLKSPIRAESFTEVPRIRRVRAEDISELRRIAGESHHDTRFYVDGNFSRETCDEPRDILAPVDREGRQLESGDPALRAHLQGGNIRSRQGQAHHAVEIFRGLIGGEAQIVRVQLPRSAMTQFGLPVNMDRADQPVKADVIMGIDGIAQAIRFVQ